MLKEVDAAAASKYQIVLGSQKFKKGEMARSKRREEDLDVYDVMLTKGEIQMHIGKVRKKGFSALGRGSKRCFWAFS